MDCEDFFLCELTIYRRKLRADFTTLGQSPNDANRTYLIGRQQWLRRRIEALYDTERHILPQVSKLREESQYNPRLRPPQDLCLLFPSVICTRVELPKDILESEFRLRESQALDALADIRACLEARAYLEVSSSGDSVDLETEIRAKSLVISVLESDIGAASRRYREAYRALEQLGRGLGMEEWRGPFEPLRAEDIRYITSYQRTYGPPMSWIWGLGGTVFVNPQDLLDITRNKGLGQGNFLYACVFRLISPSLVSAAGHLVSCLFSGSKKHITLQRTRSRGSAYD